MLNKIIAWFKNRQAADVMSPEEIAFQKAEAARVVAKSVAELASEQLSESSVRLSSIRAKQLAKIEQATFTIAETDNHILKNMKLKIQIDSILRGEETCQQKQKSSPVSPIPAMKKAAPTTTPTEIK